MPRLNLQNIVDFQHHLLSIGRRLRLSVALVPVLLVCACQIARSDIPVDFENFHRLQEASDQRQRQTSQRLVEEAAKTTRQKIQQMQLSRHGSTSLKNDARPKKQDLAQKNDVQPSASSTHPRDNKSKNHSNKYRTHKPPAGVSDKQETQEQVAHPVPNQHKLKTAIVRNRLQQQQLRARSQPLLQ